ncbi:YjgF family protein Mmf1 [Coccidioides immitis RMSCC 3703]|uniref:YjgF family protein Mmf1 n=1 Tax=Coccidioides immitis RMSCC 3703 TaxID=454286 RepID=A0A0J8QSI7_COCIT|nr:YjgF family protein Mmf1 [Coccidioides immitis RMSCC 3703]
MSAKQVVLPATTPVPLPVLSQGIIHNGIVYCSGQVGIDPASNQMVEGTVQDRTAQIFRNLSAVLEKAGSSLEKVIKVNVFLANMDDFSAMNEIYSQFLNQEPKPVRTCVAVKSLPLGTDVEIECSAYI